MAVETPSVPNRGRLQNGNPSGDYMTAPRCGAKTRRGTQCRSPAMPNGRCRMHGGTSPGPRTAAGIERIRRAVIKHGWYSAETLAQRSAIAKGLKDAREVLARIRAGEV